MAKKSSAQKRRTSDRLQSRVDESSEEPSQSEHAILQTVAEDPLAKFVGQRWRELITVLVIGFVFFYGKNMLQKSRFESLQRSADLLLNLQSEVEEVQVVSQEVKEAQKQLALKKEDSTEEDADSLKAKLTDAQERFTTGMVRARERTKALAQEQNPYGGLASLYKEVVTTIAKNTPVENAEGAIAISDLPKASGEVKGVLEELKAFQAALVSARDEATVSKAVDALTSLVRQGKFTGVASLLVLSQISDAEKISELKELTTAYLERNPDQRSLLQKELPELF